MDESQITIGALESLARILKRKVPEPEAVYFHNWQADPFFRGAYSYVPAGHLAARRALAQPVEETLYVAGEAADLKGHSGTVHGAIASGIRAAERVLASGG
jgi:monoamine oxidase